MKCYLHTQENNPKVKKHQFIQQQQKKLKIGMINECTDTGKSWIAVDYTTFLTRLVTLFIYILSCVPMQVQHRSLHALQMMSVLERCLTPYSVISLIAVSPQAHIAHAL
uniref:Uncharacterized protein n=1 Tax=Amphiprion percula TaxID=161767 RepID=A0A3P8SWL9_AMPPE